MKRKIKVAAVQMKIEPLDIAANLKKIEQMLKTIFTNSTCDLVVFPEHCITGPIPRHLEYCLDEGSKHIQLLQSLASQFKTFIIAGSFVERVKNQYFNTALLIDNQGQIILKQRKINLWIPERHYLSPGNKLTLAKTTIGKIGIAICWDLAYPEICRRLTKMGADIICCPSYWTAKDGRSLTRKYPDIPTEQNFVNTICLARTFENGVVIIYANAAETARVVLKSKIWEAPMLGQSQICVPVLGRVAHINKNNEGFIVYEYDRQLAKDAEKNYRIRQDLASNLSI